MTEPVIALDDVQVHFEQSSGWNPFNSPKTVRAVDGVSLQIPESSVVVLVGESGCGKTTLGKTAIGVQRPTNGTVRYKGHDIWKARQGEADIPFTEIRRALQMIHQDPGSSLNPNRKVMASLSAPLKRWFGELSKDDRIERIHAMLERVGMTPPGDYAQRYPHQLSGGEKQRVALVRALMMNPDLILADEAISALDVSLRIEMMDLMLELQDQFETSYLAISHDFSNARYFAGKADGYIGIMYLGEIVEFGRADDVVENPVHPYTKALRWATPDLKDVRDDELPVRSIDIPDPIDPPEGCRFHTRCPKARQECVRRNPDFEITDESSDHGVSCYRVYETHEYWDSDPLPGTDEAEDGPLTDESAETDAKALND
jgi:peptide/nickel transport system ATP-binding protein